MYLFGNFRLDPATRELHRGDNRQVLPPKVFECLVWLIEHRDRAVGRDELIAAVWGKTDAPDNLLAQVVTRLRRMLDADANESMIRTIPRFGYRWVAVTSVSAEVSVASAPAAASPPLAQVRRGPGAWGARWWLGLACAGLLVTLMTGLPGWLAGHRGGAPPAVAEPLLERALVLPVVVDGAPGNEWMRLGLMAHMIERLRSAGQPVVPGENAIALARVLARAGSGNGRRDGALATGAAAALVISSRARSVGGRWQVSLRTEGISPPLESMVEADDALQAAHEAADQMAQRLGFPPSPRAPAPADEDALTRRLVQVEAATLGGQLDIARALLEQAPQAQRHSPELRYQRAWIDFRADRLGEAQDGFQGLLADLSPTDAPLMRARSFNGLANVQYERGDIEGVRRSADAAIALLQDRNDAGEFGRALISRAVASSRTDPDAARRDLAQARVALESAGDGLGVARAAVAIGILEKARGRLGEAISVLEDAAAQLAAFDDVHDELVACIHLADAHLLLLEPAAALTLEPRLRELSLRDRASQARSLADLTRVKTLRANGRLQAASALLRAACPGANSDHDCASHTWPVLLAQLIHELDPAQGEHLLRNALETLPGGETGRESGRAWLTLLRRNITQGRTDDARQVLAAMNAWAEQDEREETRLYAALANAEQHVAANRPALARSAFEAARAQAEANQVPSDMLWVAHAYANWLIGNGDLDGASIVAGRAAGWAARDYDAALLQLRLQRALGNHAAWQTALDRAQALAAERAIPDELIAFPPHRSRSGSAPVAIAEGK